MGNIMTNYNFSLALAFTHRRYLRIHLTLPILPRDNTDWIHARAHKPESIIDTGKKRIALRRHFTLQFRRFRWRTILSVYL
jgi:hypothetical protein